VFFKDPTNVTADKSISIECEPSDTCKTAKAKLQKKLLISTPLSIATDFSGRAMSDDKTVIEAGVAQWVALVRRLPAYDEDDDEEEEISVDTLKKQAILSNSVNNSIAKPVSLADLSSSGENWNAIISDCLVSSLVCGASWCNFRLRLRSFFVLFPILSVFAVVFFFFSVPLTFYVYTFSFHDALPILCWHSFCARFCLWLCPIVSIFFL